MLTDAEQDQIIVRAFRLVRIHEKHKVMVRLHQMSQKRANELWVKHLDEFKDYLKEVGDVPMSRLPQPEGNVAKPEEAHTSNGTQVV